MVLTSEKLDTKLAPDLKSQFIILANDSASGHLIVDLGTVTFADSSGLSALLLAHRLYRDTERRLILCNLSDRVYKLIEISQLTSVFSLAEHLDAALEQIG
jgi:anti-sigma B factor antagonist